MMRRRIDLATVLLVTAIAAGTSAQDASTTLPANYQVQLENAWVKVTSVRYEPLQKLPGHAHTPNAAAYVYLNDGPEVKFRHSGAHAVVATRPATKAGAFRVYRGLEEVHEVENTGSRASEFLRVELKTAPLSPDTFRGKFERPAQPAPQPTVHVDHPQVRISRLWVLQGRDVGVSASDEPALLIALKPGAGFRLGEARWLAPSTTMQLENTTSDDVDFLRFDFKTKPAPASR